MKKVMLVAWREFVATVATKGFIIGVLITPALIAAMAIFMPMMWKEQPPTIEGEVALYDPTGVLAEPVEEYLSPEEIARRWELLKEEAEEEMPPEIRQLMEQPGSEATSQAAMDYLARKVTIFHVHMLPEGADIEVEKDFLRTEDERNLLAIAVVHDDAVVKTDDEDQYGTFDLYVREGLDDRIEGEVRSALRQSIRGARIEAAGYDRATIEALTRVPRTSSTTVTESGEQETNEVLNVLLPVGFMVLLLVSVFTSGQYIMTTTVEEKSSRVVEVLLSAVSPMQLMTGKIIGQLCVGLVILALYAGMGISALFSFALMGMVDMVNFFYLIIFYLIAYFVVGSLMAAIGSAVNEMREAQTLMTPVMVVMMIPWILWMPITRDPNSVFATVTSFIPPLNTFVMLLRMNSTTPPPTWQIWLSIAIGIASVYAALWFAAKVFRVGLLMFGKPPNFATLIKWVRMA